MSYLVEFCRFPLERIERIGLVVCHTEWLVYPAPLLTSKFGDCVVVAEWNVLGSFPVSITYGTPRDPTPLSDR